ncbi:hypothetical protein LEMLEM_LOCUS22972, partial [Lemmus lemmus]
PRLCFLFYLPEHAAEPPSSFSALSLPYIRINLYVSPVFPLTSAPYDLSS